MLGGQLALALTLLLASNSGAAGTVEPCGPGTFGADEAARVVSEYKGKGYDSCVIDEVLARTPSWSEDDDSPPLPPRAAIREARAELSILLPNPQEWQTDQVNLMHVGPIDKWIYVVQFSGPISTPYGGVGTTFRLLVLMDGKVVEPRVVDMKETRR